MEGVGLEVVSIRWREDREREGEEGRRYVFAYYA